MANTYLTRTLGSPTSSKIGTLSWWQKGATTDTTQYILACESGNERLLWYMTSGRFQGGLRASSTPPDIDFTLSGTPRFRDPNMWYHCVLSWDSSQGTPADRIKFYVNNVEYTVVGSGTSGVNDIPQDHTMPMNKSGLPFRIGSTIGGGSYFVGSMSHMHFIDGIRYAPSVFGSTDSTTGEWKINDDPSGISSYGNNGFWWLKNTNALTDSSPNSNTPTQGGAGLTLTQDNPSNSFATFDTLRHSGSDYSFGNTHCYTVSGTYESRPTYSSLGMQSGKYYAEVKVEAPNSGNPDYALIGITGRNVPNLTGSEQYVHLGSQSQDYAVYSYNGNMMNNTGSSNNGSTYAATYTTNDIIGIALDLDNNKLYFSKNGAWANGSGAWGSSTFDSTVGAITIAAPTTTQERFYFFAVDAYHYTPRYNFAANFGNGYFNSTTVTSEGTNASANGIFEYDVPTGYTALSTKGLNL